MSRSSLTSDKKERTDSALIRIRPGFRHYLKIEAVKQGIPLYKLLENYVAYVFPARPWDKEKVDE